MSNKILIVTAAALLLAACSQSDDKSTPTIDAGNDAKALGIALSSIIIDTHITEHPELAQSELRRVYPAIYAAEHGPLLYATVSDVLDHFDHVVSLTSVDSVGIGSDFDGVGDSLPVGLKDVATYPNLIKGLLERDYSEAEIRKILGENLLRVWQAAADYAAK